MMQRPAGTSDNIIGLRMRMDTIGRVALLLILAEDPQAVMASAPAYQIVLGHVGTMDVQKIIAAIETAARRERFIGPEYAEEHALYHATIEALHGISRGQIALGPLLRTVGLRFSLVRGPRLPGDQTTWIAVALFGTIGQPVKGMEHEAVGLGIFHV
jgi:hut operon positive regulatory protein